MQLYVWCTTRPLSLNVEYKSHATESENRTFGALLLGQREYFNGYRETFPMDLRKTSCMNQSRQNWLRYKKPRYSGSVIDVLNRSWYTPQRTSIRWREWGLPKPNRRYASTYQRTVTFIYTAVHISDQFTRDMELGGGEYRLNWASPRRHLGIPPHKSDIHHRWVFSAPILRWTEFLF
jgi:hypothetical protein